MRYISAANGELNLSTIGLGCMSMSGLYGPADDAESIRTIHRAIELGVNFLDTSVSYGSGHNQELIGKALKGRRDQVIVHSKFGIRRDPDGNLIGLSASPETVRENCEDSLRRFGFDVIDVWCPSRPDPDVPVEDTIGEMIRLKEEGKIRYFGVSECGPAHLRRAAAAHPLVSLQMEYSLLSRDAEATHVPLCRELGMVIMGYAPFARGLIAGAVDTGTFVEGDTRAGYERYSDGNLEKNLALLSTARDMAADKGISVARLAVAWSLAKGAPIIPFPGAKSRDHLEDNVAALEVSLSTEDMAALDAAYPPGAAAGLRYSAAQLAAWHGE